MVFSEMAYDLPGLIYIYICLVKSNRSSSSSSGKFPPMSASLNRYPAGYLVEPKQQTDFPIYESAHPSYYAPAQGLIFLITNKLDF
jgi:hypothetical protein